jgi:hypothetical protein
VLDCELNATNIWGGVTCVCSISTNICNGATIEAEALGELALLQSKVDVGACGLDAHSGGALNYNISWVRVESSRNTTVVHDSNGKAVSPAVGLTFWNTSIGHIIVVNTGAIKCENSF